MSPQSNCELCQQWLGWRGRRAEGCGAVGREVQREARKTSTKLEMATARIGKQRGRRSVCDFFHHASVCPQDLGGMPLILRKKPDSRESPDELRCS